MLRNDGLSTRHDYEKETRLCLEFLTSFEDPSLSPDPTHGRKKYKIAPIADYPTGPGFVTKETAASVIDLAKQGKR